MTNGSTTKCPYYPECGADIKNTKESLECFRGKLETQRSEMWESIHSKTSLKLFMWVAGLLFAAFLVVTGYQASIIERLSKDLSDVKADTAAIKATVEMIREKR
jgi:hypothetical protein